MATKKTQDKPLQVDVPDIELQAGYSPARHGKDRQAEQGKVLPSLAEHSKV